jgi:hypothetical protein
MCSWVLYTASSSGLSRDVLSGLVSLGYKPACCDSALADRNQSMGSGCESAPSVALLGPAYLGVCASAAHACAPAAHEWDTGACSNFGRRRCGAASPAPAASVAGSVSYLRALTSAADAGSNRVFRRRRASSSDSGTGSAPFSLKPSRRSGDLLRDPGVPCASSAPSWAPWSSFAAGLGWSNGPYGVGGGLVGVSTTPPAP